MAKKNKIRRCRKTNRNHKQIRSSKTRKSQIHGGKASNNVLFACTTLDKDSTLSENFEQINDIVRNLLPLKRQNTTLNAYFVYKVPRYFGDEIIHSNMTSDYLKQTLEQYNYKLVQDGEPTGYNVFDMNLVDFVNSKKTNTKFDLIVLTQCSDTRCTVMGEKERSTDMIANNLYSLYDCLSNTHGYLVNIGYNHDDAVFENFEDSISYVTLTSALPCFLLIVELIPLLFTRISTGIYKKIPSVEKQVLTEKANEINHNLVNKIAILKDRYQETPVEIIKSLVPETIYQQYDDKLDVISTTTWKKIIDKYF